MKKLISDQPITTKNYFISNCFFNGEYIIDTLHFETGNIQTFRFSEFDDFKNKLEELQR